MMNSQRNKIIPDISEREFQILQLVSESYTSQDIADANQKGHAVISVLDKISGRALSIVNATITETGQQRVAIPLKGLSFGIYLVRVDLNGKTLFQQLTVR